MKYPSFQKLLLAGTLLLSARAAQAQDETDALRYSLLQPQGTARSMGFGSALGSVGGDFSTLSVNPAGIGIYRRSEVMFTPSVSFNGTSASLQNSTGYSGSSSDASGSHFSFSNVGVVWASAAKGRRYERSAWKSFSFGIGINRLADFTRDYTYAGKNTSSSQSFVFEDDANNGSQDISSHNTPAYLGYESYLINPDSASGFYLAAVNPTAAHPVTQLNSVKERGGISELVFSLGGNYKEHLMLGATIGLPVVNYTRDRTYSESDLAGASLNFLNSYTYNESLRTSGLGINLKLGIIYKPNDNVRFGAAIHTPTVYGLTDVQDQTVNSFTISNGLNTIPASQNTFDYTLTTPWRGILSGTAMLGKYGFFTLDYEYVDYSSAHFSFSDAIDKPYEQQINDVIKSDYRGASNIRTGVEIKLDQLALRAGFGYYGSPYKSSVYSNGDHYELSGGLGFRFGKTFLDLAYVHRMYKNPDQPYALPTYYDATAVPKISNYVPVIANLNNSANTIALTVGWKF